MNIQPQKCEVLRQELWKVQYAEGASKEVCRLAQIMEDILDMIDPLPGKKEIL